MRHSIHSVFYDQAEAHEAAGRYEEALALYYQVHRWAAKDGDLWLRMGVLSFLMTDPAWIRANGREGSHVADMAAVNTDVYLERALALAPDVAQARFWRGWVRHRLFQDVDGATADLEAAIALQPQFAYAHAALARVELSRDDADAQKALGMLGRATAALPESARLHYDLGTCHLRLDDVEAARAAFQRALAAPSLGRPAGPGGRHLADEFHGERRAISDMMTRYFPDVLM